MINLPKVLFFLSALSLQTFCSINTQHQGLTPQFQQEKTHELIRLVDFLQIDKNNSLSAGCYENGIARKYILTGKLSFEVIETEYV